MTDDARIPADHSARGAVWPSKMSRRWPQTVDSELDGLRQTELKLMTFYGSVTIALAIFLSSVVLAVGGRYQIVTGAEVGRSGAAWKIDRFTGDVQFCERVEDFRPARPAAEASSHSVDDLERKFLANSRVRQTAFCN